MPVMEQIKCEKPRPICLNKEKSKGKINKCGGVETSPIELLGYIATEYLPAENTNPVVTNEDVTNVGDDNCYDFSTAWLAVIQNIKHNIVSVTKEDLTPESINEVISNIEFTSNTITLTELFTKIIHIGTGKFGEGNPYVKGLNEIVESPGFKNVSDTLVQIVNGEIQISDNYSLPSHKNIESIKQNLIALFDYTLPIMNEATDIGNVYNESNNLGNNIDKIKDMFNGTQSTGGGNKTKKTRKYKKTHGKRKGNTKNKKNIRKTRKIKQKGGDFGASAIIGIIFFAIFIYGIYKATRLPSPYRPPIQDIRRVSSSDSDDRWSSY